jgi:hypothetical protein
MEASGTTTRPPRLRGSLRTALSEQLGSPVAGSELAETAGQAGFVWTLLPRHGRRPARFLGREMLRADNRAGRLDGGLPYWSDIRIFELHAGGFVTAVRHLGNNDDRPGWQDVWLAEDAAGVVRSLRAHSICAAWPHAGETACAEAQMQAWSELVDAIFGDAASA